MKKILLFICLFLPIILNADISIKSESGILMEESTHKIIYEHNSEEALAPASMTKIMTMLLLMEEIDKGSLGYDDQVTISSHAASMGGSQVWLQEGSVATIKELLTAIAIGSANDAAVAVAEKIGGTEENFVSMMNERAKELGCKNTTFKNAHGLDEEGHVSTAYDMALMASELIKHKEILELTSTYETNLTHQNGKTIWLVNTNSLLKAYKGLDGLKTGYTPNALYCLTATMERNGMRLISVVMKAETKENRNVDTVNLMEYGYSMYYQKDLLDNKEELGNIFIDNTKNRYVKYYLKDDVSLILDKDTRDIKYNYDIDLYQVKAPLSKGSVVGKLKLNYNGEVIEYDLVVKSNIKEAKYFRRMINYFKDIIFGNLSIV